LGWWDWRGDVDDFDFLIAGGKRTTRFPWTSRDEGNGSEDLFDSRCISRLVPLRFHLFRYLLFE
jgi:hypothetical protein